MFFKDFRDLIRLPLGIVASIAGITGGYLVTMLENQYNTPIAVFLDSSNFMLLAVGMWIPFLIVCGAQSINDYFDYESDVINNRQDRPLVRGAFKPQTALYLGLAMLLGGVVLSFIVTKNILVSSITVFLGIVAIWYNTGIEKDGILGPLKKTGFLGNVVISFCYTAPYVLGAMVMGISNTTWVTVLGLAATTFFAGLGREIIKGIMDREGDKSVNIATLAVKFGNQTAAYIAVLFFGFSILSSIIPILPSQNSFRDNFVYWIGISFFNLLLIYISYSIIKNATVKNATICRKRTRTLLWVGAMVFLLSGIFHPYF